MNCKRVEQLLSEQLEGLVTEREIGPMKAHLGECPVCCRLQEERDTGNASSGVEPPRHVCRVDGVGRLGDERGTPPA